MVDTCNAVAKGDLSTFLRDWMGSLIPIGYQKDIGFEYQYTSERGFEGWVLLQGSTTTFATYAGEGPQGRQPQLLQDDSAGLLPDAPAERDDL